MAGLDLLDQIESNLSVKKVSIVEFAESDEYCDTRLYPRQRILLKLMFLEELTGAEEDVLDYWINGGRNGTEIVISPLIRERVQYLRENGYPHFREVNLVGGRRSSKGFVTGLAMGKVMFDCWQLQDPGMYYGIDQDKDIYFSCIAASEDQAKKFQYADLISTVERCKKLTPHIGKSLETEFGIITESDRQKISRMKKVGQRQQRRYERVRGNALTSNASTLRGSTTMAFVIDEMAHMLPGESRASADQVYDAAEPSLDQFGADGMIFCNSSPYTKVGKFFERHQAALEVIDNEPKYPTLMTFEFPSWALFEGYQDDPERKFKKAITVSADWDPDQKNEDGTYYHSPEDRRAIKVARDNESQNPEKYKVERRAKFAEIVDAYLNPQMVDIMFKGRPEGVSDEGEIIYAPYPMNWGNATYRHRYVAHLDPSSTTAGFGFALGHIEYFTDTEGREAQHVVFDIIKRWDPKSFAGGVINYEYVLDEIMTYIELFRPDEVTMDQFSSGPLLQELQQRVQRSGIKDTIRLYEKPATAEMNWKRAETFKTALYQGFVHGPTGESQLEYANLELKYLQQLSTSSRFPRVDKQDFGPVQTKDMADCIMTVTEALIGSVLSQQMREALSTSLAPGAQGGYDIGGQDHGGQGQPVHPDLSHFYNRRSGEQSMAGGTGNAFSRIERVMNRQGNPARGRFPRH
jgi:hypothetical protein